MLKHSQGGWTVFTRCWICHAKMSTISSAWRVHQCFYLLLCTFPPGCKLKNGLQKLYDVICRNQKQPVGIFIVASDFNQTDLRIVLPNFHHHILIPIRSWTMCIHIFLYQIIFLCFSCLLTTSVLRNIHFQWVQLSFKSTLRVHRLLGVDLNTHKNVK